MKYAAQPEPVASPAVGHEMMRLRAAVNGELLLRSARAHWRPADESTASLLSCDVERLHDRGRNGFVIEYSMTLDTGDGRLTRRLFGHLPNDDAEAVRDVTLGRLRKRMRNDNGSKRALSEISLLPDLGIILRPPGLDERVDGLHMLQGPAPARSPLAPYDQCHLLAHRLGKRAVLSLEAGDPPQEGRARVILKLYKRRSAKVARIVKIHRTLEELGYGANQDFANARVLDRHEALHGVTLEHVPGRQLSDLGKDLAPKGYELAGAAIAGLHNVPIRPDTMHFPLDDLDLLHRWLEIIVAIYPLQKELFSQALRRARRGLLECRPFDLRFVHRDFHEKQILYDGTKAYLIDFDTACTGDCAQDVGNFLAHLRLAELQRGTCLKSLEAAFRGGYSAIRKLPVLDNVNAHYRATLLRLACIYSFNDRWRHLVPALLQDV